MLRSCPGHICLGKIVTKKNGSLLIKENNDDSFSVVTFPLDPLPMIILSFYPDRSFFVFKFPCRAIFQLQFTGSGAPIAPNILQP
jgi:hypothetical protein